MNSHATTFWGISLSPGLHKKNMVGFYLTCFTSIMLATFVPQTQPFLLTEVLQIEISKQGSVSGNLSFIGEIVIILSVGLWGSLSDKVGRKVVTALGYIFMAGGILLYGLSTSISDLIIARSVYAAGIAAASTMIITLMADYARNESRGRATGFLGVMNGLGAMVAALVLLRLPSMYQGQGLDAEAAALATYGTMAGITFLVAIILLTTLRGGTIAQAEAKVSLSRQFIEGLIAVKNPGIRLAYGASFVARGNLAVVGTFFTLWASIYGTEQLGLTTAEAIKKGGLILTISYIASLLSAPVFGILSDKFDRVTMLIITLTIGVIGYCSTFFFVNPFSTGMMVCLIFIGMAEVGCIITSGVLIAEQSPDNIRGSVIGMFTLSGAVGILIASAVGGQLFDHWMQSGPFVFFGLIAAAVLIWAIAARKNIKPQKHAPDIDPLPVETVEVI